MSGPVAVGALGGSGTRVVAAMLQEAGYYLGADLNRALDNLWYTILLKRRHLAAAEEAEAIEVFLAAMRGELVLEEGALDVVARAGRDVALQGHDARGAGRGHWAFQRVVSLLRAQQEPVPGERWGWKEPNTHVRLPALCDRVEGLRYVHVVRHGVDMAFSRNQAQLHWWGPMMGVEVPDDPDRVPAASLRYWALTTRRALELGESRLGERFLLLRFEDLCAQPRTSAERLLDFLDLPAESQLVSRLAALPSAPASMGRHRGVDLTGFDPQDLATVSRLGYEVEG